MESPTKLNPQDLRKNVYFQNKRIREHLIKAGLINRQGVILPAAKNAERKKRQPQVVLSPLPITNYMIEEERKQRRFLRNYFDFAMKRDRIQKIRESRRAKRRTKSLTFVDANESFQSKKTRTQSSDRKEKRSLNRVKSARSIPLSVKNLLPHRPTTAKSRIIEDNCEVTMIYYGPPNNTEQKGKEADEIIIMQQHNGGENLPVFKGFVRPNEIFKFISRRHPDYPFALALYINGLIDTRISVCCEYKHKHNVRLGSKYGLFGIYDVKKSQPCRMCRFEQRRKQILATSPVDHRPSPYRRSVLTTSFSPGHLLRTPVVTPEKNKTPKDQMNRVSTVARASGSSRASASPTTHSGSEDKILNMSFDTEPVRRSSITTNSSSSNFPKKTDVHHSSEPLLSKRYSDSDESAKQYHPSKPTNGNHTKSRTPSESSSITLSTPSPPNNKHTKKRSSPSSSSSEESLKAKKEPLYNRPIAKTPSERSTSSASNHSKTNDENHIKSRSSSNHSLKIPQETISNKRTSKTPSERSTSSASNHSKTNDQNHIESRSSSNHSLKIPQETISNKRTSKTPSERSTSSASNHSKTNGENHIESRSSSNASNHLLKIPQEAIYNKRISETPSEKNPKAKTPSRSSSKASNQSDQNSVRSRSSLPSDHAFKFLADLIPVRPNSATLSQCSTSSESIQLLKNTNLSPTSSDSTIKQSPSKASDTPLKNETDVNARRNSSPSSLIHESLPQLPLPFSSDEQNALKSHSDTTDEDEEEIIEIKPRRGQNDEGVSTNEEKTPKRQYRAVENLVLIWLDATLENPDQETLNTKRQLRQITRTLQNFSDPTKCLQLIQEIRNEKIFFIISGSLSEQILPRLIDYPQVVAVYIYCQEKSKYEHLIHQYPIVKSTFTDISTICQDLKIDYKQWDNDLSTFQICSDEKLFLQNQLLKSYLLDIEYDSNLKDELVVYCLKLYTENDHELDLIKDFAENYQAKNAIQWYTKDCFAYHMLNRAIRIKDMKMLMEMGFFLQDIHQQIDEIYSHTVHPSVLTVFRGQGMKLEHFKELQQHSDSLLSFNGFVSTSKRQDVAYEFAQHSLKNGFPIAVLFQIKIDPKSASCPFISVENLSSNPNEYELLLSFQSIFQIESIEQIENNLWQIDLNLTDQFSFTIESEREKYQHLNDYEKLAELLIDMNELTKAKDLFEMNIPSNTSPKYSYVYRQLASISIKLDAPNQALLYYNLALHSKCPESLNDTSTLVYIHKEMGKIFYKQKKYREALEKFQYVLNLQLEHFSSDEFTLIDTYEYLAMINEDNGDYETALAYRQNQLDIQEDSSVTKQTDLARTYLKIAICLENLNQLDEALENIQTSIDTSPIENSESDERQSVLDRIRELMK